jgi:hypothetical protein
MTPVRESSPGQIFSETGRITWRSPPKRCGTLWTVS